MKKIIIPIAVGLTGSAMGAVVYLVKPFMRHILKNLENVSVYTFIFFGFVAGFLLAFIWFREKENGK
ncbi:MAG: hypothetical protein V1933_03770 [Candidatus Omnitrophota bacterium]